jgi:LacI family transcriptional regulator
MLSCGVARRRRFTIREVARLANVSISTVSAVINQTAHVSDERVARVREAMTALDYHPDEVARSLKTGRTNVVGVVVPDITNVFYPEVIRGVEEAAAAAGYGVLLCDSNENAANEDKHLSMLSARRVDGVLLACCAQSTAYAAVARRRFPTVFVDRLPPAPVEGTVSTDNVQAGYMATRHLIELGHKRIALLAGHVGLSTHRDRIEGFRKAMQESHLPLPGEYLASGGVQVEDGLATGRALLRLATRPTAVMASNHKLLLGLLQALEEGRVEAPRRMSVLGFDDYLWNKYSSPSLTAVAQPTYEMGKRSFELLLAFMRRDAGQSPIDKHIRLCAELRVRNSTAPPG